MRLEEMVLQENFTCELQLTLRAGIVVRPGAMSRQRTLPLEECLTARTREGKGPGPDATGDFFFLVFLVGVITQTVRVVELKRAEFTFE